MYIKPDTVCYLLSEKNAKIMRKDNFKNESRIRERSFLNLHAPFKAHCNLKNKTKYHSNFTFS